VTKELEHRQGDEETERDEIPDWNPRTCMSLEPEVIRVVNHAVSRRSYKQYSGQKTVYLMADIDPRVRSLTLEGTSSSNVDTFLVRITQVFLRM
jgi:hypothetical protein